MRSCSAVKKGGRELLLRWLSGRPLPGGWRLASVRASLGGLWFVSFSLFPSPDKTSLSQPSSSLTFVLYVLSCPAGGGEVHEERQTGEALTGS